MCFVWVRKSTNNFRYLKGRNSEPYKAIFGVGFPLHKGHPYSLYTLGEHLQLRYLKCLTRPDFRLNYPNCPRLKAVDLQSWQAWMLLYEKGTYKSHIYIYIHII